MHVWDLAFMLGGIVGGELVAWARRAVMARRKPGLSIAEATAQIKAELAEHRRQVEDAMWRVVFGENE